MQRTSLKEVKVEENEYAPVAHLALEKLEF